MCISHITVLVRSSQLIMVRVVAGNVLQGLLVIGLAYSGSDTTTAIIYLILATGVHGAVTSGPLSNVVDISPNFASKYSVNC